MAAQWIWLFWPVDSVNWLAWFCTPIDVSQWMAIMTIGQGALFDLSMRTWYICSLSNVLSWLYLHCLASNSADPKRQCCGHKFCHISSVHVIGLPYWKMVISQSIDQRSLASLADTIRLAEALERSSATGIHARQTLPRPHNWRFHLFGHCKQLDRFESAPILYAN